jgi:hypothetical protein
MNGEADGQLIVIAGVSAEFRMAQRTPGIPRWHSLTILHRLQVNAFCHAKSLADFNPEENKYRKTARTTNQPPIPYSLLLPYRAPNHEFPLSNSLSASPRSTR